MSTSLLLKDIKQATAALSIATFGTVPPAKANMVDVAAMRRAGGSGFAPRVARVLLKGGQAGVQTITGGVIWGWDKDADLPVQIALLNDGLDVVITNARFYAQLLYDVIGAFTHIGVTGGLTASTVVVEVAPIEAEI